jgi:hypothetical protein
MLSVQRCRKLLGVHCSLTDSEIETLRDQLYCLAEVAMNSLPDQLQIKGGAAETLTQGSKEGPVND